MSIGNVKTAELNWDHKKKNSPIGGEKNEGNREDDKLKRIRGRGLKTQYIRRGTSSFVPCKSRQKSGERGSEYNREQDTAIIEPKQRERGGRGLMDVCHLF